VAEESRFLFVYGTLRRGLRHPVGDRLSPHTRRIDPATVPGQLFNTGRYPAAVPSGEPGDLVHGELYELNDPDEVWPWLDEYEGYFPGNVADSLFVRRLSLVQRDDAGPLHAWVYWYNRPVDGFERILIGGCE